jgi:WD40 repeat protein
MSAPPTILQSPLHVFGDPELHTDGEILTLAFGKHGTLWSVEETGVVRQWCALSGRQLAHQQLSDLETQWAFSADASRVAAGSNELAIWDTFSGRLLAALPQTSWVTALSFAGEFTRVATGHDDGTVCLWDTNWQVLLRSLLPHEQTVSSVAFSPDGQRLASADEGKNIVVSSTLDGEILLSLNGHTDRIPQLAWHPGAKLLFSAGWDGTVRVWNTETGQPIETLKGHEAQVVALAVSMDGRFLASADSAGQIHLWQYPALKRVHILATGAAELRSLGFSPDGQLLASGGNDRRIHLWDVAKDRPRFGGSVLANLPTSVANSADGFRLATNAGGRGCRVWDRATRQLALTLTDNEAVGAIACSPDGCWIAGAVGCEVRLWHAQTGALHATLPDHEEPITVLAFSADSQLLAAASNSGMGVSLWSPAQADPILVIPDALDGCVIHAMAFHPRNQLLAVGGIDWMATGGSDGAISFWDVGERCEVATFASGTTALAFGPAGARLLSATLDHALILWDTATREPIAEFDGHDAMVNGVAFSPDGRLLASGSDDRTVRFWDSGAAGAVAVRELDTQIKALCFSPDGQHVFTGNANTTCYAIAAPGRS